jgi:hypothetical protein
MGSSASRDSAARDIQSVVVAPGPAESQAKPAAVKKFSPLFQDFLYGSRSGMGSQSSRRIAAMDINSVSAAAPDPYTPGGFTGAVRSAADPIQVGSVAPVLSEELSLSAEEVTMAEVREAQAKWAEAIARISKTYLEGGDYVAAAGDAAGELYGYGHTNVMFKPTKAADKQFRPLAQDAMSYFVGAEAVSTGGIPEDGGFAINGGKGWQSVQFENHSIELLGNAAVAMGNYYFTCATTGDVAKVEYTFGYKKCSDGKLRIFLHHSSVPYNAGAPAAEAATAPVTAEEVAAVQTAWAGAIKNISAVYKAKGDYITAAADAAGELYAYGHDNVLFKPTKAAEYQFRSTAQEAMSYFVGGDAVEGGYAEDGGFAINGGKGWADCVYDNHRIDVKGDIALAMGNYYFTCATTGEVTKVEYTFGYTRCDDGNVRICLHHSSVPYSA